MVYWVAAPIGQGLLMAWLIARAVVDGPNGSSWSGRWLPGRGTISYGIYVYHVPIRSYVDKYDPTWTQLMPRIVGVVITIAVVWLSYRLMKAALRRIGRELAGNGLNWPNTYARSNKPAP